MDLLRFLVLLFFSFSFSKRGVVVFSFSKNLAKGDEFALPIASGEGSIGAPKGRRLIIKSNRI